jgi:sec-independent protein translocase protein TatB
MFGLSAGELVIIAIVALLVVGPDKLPDAARSIGRTIRDFRRQTKDLQDSLEADAQVGDAVRELRGALHGMNPRRSARQFLEGMMAPPRAQAGTEGGSQPAAPASDQLAASAPAADVPGQVAGAAAPVVAETGSDAGVRLVPAAGTVAQNSSVDRPAPAEPGAAARPIKGAADERGSGHG